jgi:hypothetical protein
MSIPPSNIPLMSLPTFYNIHESPGTYFKEAIREIRCRIKLCELYSAYLDDFANVEDIYGKIIVKVFISMHLPFYPFKMHSLCLDWLQCKRNER